MARQRDQRWWLRATLAVVALAGGCGWRDLHHDDLFGPPDAEMPAVDAGAEGDAGVEVDADASAVMDVGPELGTDVAVTDAVAPVDAVDTQPDLGTTDVGTDADTAEVCTPTSCASGSFCDDLSQRCQPSTGVGMLSGVVYNVCNHREVQARVGIAGQHQCSVEQKGAYYFRANLPVGLLTLSAYAEGYLNFSIPVEIKATGTVQDIAMMPNTPGGCADPVPMPVVCTCTIAGCPGVP